MPVFAVLLLVLAFGITIPLANLRILFPDLSEIIPVMLQRLMSLNPPYYFIRSFRDVLIEHSLPPMNAWLSMGIWIAIFLTVAQLASRHMRNEVKDLL